MRTRINLEYVLMKNKTDLQTFLSKNSIENYAQLLAYCHDRNLNPVSEEAFSAVAPSRKKTPAPEEKAVDESSKQTKGTKATRTTRRSTSKTQAKPRTRSSSKKVKSSQ